jgi:hypothetical protein
MLKAHGTSVSCRGLVNATGEVTRKLAPLVSAVGLPAPRQNPVKTLPELL